MGDGWVMDAYSIHLPRLFGALFECVCSLYLGKGEFYSQLIDGNLLLGASFSKLV